MNPTADTSASCPSDEATGTGCMACARGTSSRSRLGCYRRMLPLPIAPCTRRADQGLRRVEAAIAILSLESFGPVDRTWNEMTLTTQGKLNLDRRTLLCRVVPARSRAILRWSAAELAFSRTSPMQRLWPSNSFTLATLASSRAACNQVAVMPRLSRVSFQTGPSRSTRSSLANALTTPTT